MECHDAYPPLLLLPAHSDEICKWNTEPGMQIRFHVDPVIGLQEKELLGFGKQKYERFKIGTAQVQSDRIVPLSFRFGFSL